MRDTGRRGATWELLTVVLLATLLVVGGRHNASDVKAADAPRAARLAPGPLGVTLTNAATGKPAPGVGIRIGGRYLATDAQGVAIFEGLPAGKFQLAVEHTGYDRLEQPIELTLGKRQPIALKLSPTQIVKVNGLVKLEGDGRALAGARVTLTPVAVPASCKGKVELCTNFEGKFVILELAAGKYRADVRAPGCKDGTFELTIAPNMKPVEMALVPVFETASLTVNVVDSVSGKPVPGAKVALAEAFPKGLIAEAQGDAAGKAVFKELKLARLNWMDAKGKIWASRRRVQVRAEAEGYATNYSMVSLDTGAQATVKLNSTLKMAEQEPNDAPATAQDIRVGTPVMTKIQKIGDVDHFRIRLEQPAHLRVAIGPKPPIETTLALLRRDGSQIALTPAYANTPNAFEADVPSGEYIVVVREWGDNGSSNEEFELLVSANWAVDCNEPNDSPTAARTLQTGEEVRGYITPVGDVDHFRFQLKRAGTVRFKVDANAIEKWLTIYNEKGEAVGNGCAYANTPFDVVAGLPAGWYTARFGEWGDNGCTNDPYSFRFETTEDDGIDDPAPKGKRFAAVRTLELNGVAGNTIDPLGDIDTYAVTLPAAGALYARVIAPIEMLVNILDVQGNVLASGVAYANTPASATWHAASPQTVYVQVREWGDNGRDSSPYLVSAWFDTCDENDMPTRNDKPEAATPLELSETMRANISPYGDVDAYRLNIDHAGWLHVTGNSGGTEIIARVLNAKKKVLSEVAAYPNSPFQLAVGVQPGEYFLEVREWGDNGWSLSPYWIKASLGRGEPRERVITRDDPIRNLKAGVAQPFVIEHIGDRDRFSFAAPKAGKYTLRAWCPIEYQVRVYDDRTEKAVFDNVAYGRNPLVAQLEAKGATRYRIEVTEWGDNGCSPEQGWLFIDDQAREIAGGALTATADPFDPTLINFTLTQVKELGKVAKASVDADGDGTTDFEIAAGQSHQHRVSREGLYQAAAVLKNDAGAMTISRVWVEAIGAPERKGVRLMVHHPGDGLIETDEPARASAISYSGARIAHVGLWADGKHLGYARTAPFDFDVPWQKLGAGKHTLKFVALDARGDSATVERTVSVSDYFDLQPPDGAVLSGNSARVSWIGGAFGPAKVRYRPQGTTDWREAAGDNGRNRLVVLSDLESGKVYEFQPVGGTEAGPIRTLTRVKGLAFGKSKYAGNIQRDYDQKLGVSVRNQSDRPMTVRLECGKPEEASKLLVGFVGDGSQGAPFSLKPGEERDFLLGISAQDCIKPLVKFPVRLTSDAGLNDEAQVEVSVKLPEVKLEWQKLGAAPDGLSENWRLINKGDGLTDLAVGSKSPDLLLTPSVSHGILPPGTSMDFIARPRLHDEFKGVESALSTSAVDKTIENPVKIALKEGQQVYGVHLTGGAGDATSMEQDILKARTLAGAYLNPGYVNWSKRQNPQDTDNDGKPDRWTIDDKFEGILWTGDDTDGDGQVDFVHADIGSDGQYDYSAFKTKDGWEPTNLVEANLEMGFKLPWARSAYEKHDVDLVMGGKVIGTMRDTIPEGNYTFKIPPSALTFDESGSPGNNEIEIQSKHLRGGHYVISSDFAIKTRMTGSHVYVVGESREKALESVKKLNDLSTEGPDYSVSSAEVRLEGEMRKGADIVVVAPVRNVGSTRTRSVTVALGRSAPGGQFMELTRASATDVPLSGSIDVRIPWKAAAGKHSLHVIVDPDKDGGDKQRENNIAVVNLEIPGDDAKPTLKILEPIAGATLKDTIAALKVEAKDDAGLARVEFKVDNGLYAPLDGAEADAYAGKALLQPGSHTLSVRVIDGSGNTVEQSVSVSVDAKTPTVKIVGPKDAAPISARQTKVEIEASDDAAAAAVRVNDGPWKTVDLKDGKGSATLDLEFGAAKLEAMAVNARGARAMSTLPTQCTAQRTAEENGPGAGGNAADSANGGRPAGGAAAAARPAPLNIDGVGPVDAFGAPNAPITPPGNRGAGRPGAGGAATPPAGGETATPGGAPGATNTGDGGAAATNTAPDGGAAATDAAGAGEYDSAPATTVQPGDVPPPMDQNPNNRPIQPTNTGPDQPETGTSRPMSSGPVKPAGGFVSSQSRASDWYCTNRPNIKVKFRLPDWLKRKNLTYADKKEYDAMVKKFIDDMKRRGIDTRPFEKFQDALRRRVRGLNQPGELPGFLESIGFGGPAPEDPVALAKWREQMERAADAWYLRLLASGDPQLVAEGLKARAEAIGKFDEAMQEHANACIETIKANQKLVEDCVESLPVIGDITDLYAGITGTTLLTEEKISALERAIRLAGVLGPVGIEQLLKRSPSAQLVAQGLGEMADSLGSSGKQMLANVLGKEVKEVDKALKAFGDFMTQDIKLTRNAMKEDAEKAAKAFAKTPEGMADAVRRNKEFAESKDLIERLQKHAPDSPEFKQAVKELQANKHAQGMINGKAIRDDLRQKVNGEIKSIYKTADAGTKADLEKFLKSDLPEPELRKMAQDLGMDPNVALQARAKAREAVEKAGKKIDDVDVDVMNITNSRPPKPGEKTVTSVGRDRDVTYVIKDKNGKNIIDVDHTLSEGPYNKNFYGATNDGKIPMKDGKVDWDAIRKNADDLDQTVTSKWHKEAYNTGDVQLNDFLDKSKTPTLTRIEDVRDTVTWKSDHWFHKAEQAGKAKDAVMEARHAAEGMRQATKQWDDLIMSRAKQYGLSEKNIPPRLAESMNIFKQVKDGAISPAQADKMLKAIGTTKEAAVKDMGTFLEGMEKTVGKGWRQVKTAELVNNLHKLPGKGSAEWTGQALSQINDALKRGEVSGPVFLKLRQDALNGMLNMPKTPTWKQDLARWADQALQRRLISESEKAMLEAQAN